MFIHHLTGLDDEVLISHCVKRRILDEFIKLQIRDNLYGYRLSHYLSILKSKLNFSWSVLLYYCSNTKTNVLLKYANLYVDPQPAGVE